MPIGEIPITSYFSRAPQKKRKKNPGSHKYNVQSAPTKRKRLDSEESEDSQTAAQKEKKQASLPFPKASRKTAPPRTTPQVRPQARLYPDESMDSEPQTSPSSVHTATRIPSPSPGMNNAVSGSHVNKLHLSPPGKKAVALPSPPLGSRHAINPPKRNWSEVANLDDLDALSVPSSQSQYITTSHCHNPLPPGQSDDIPSSQSQSQSQYITTRSSLSPEPSNDDIPSSQSQYFLPFESPRLRNDPSIIYSVPSSQSQSQYLPRPKPKDVEAEPVHRDDDGFVVPSSQSQWMLPLDDFRATPNAAITAADDEVIPSSQSQFELELMPSSASGRRRCVSFESSRQPNARPDAEIDVADFFEDPSTLLSPAPLKDQDDSATESDDDVPAILPKSSKLAQPPSPELDGYFLQSGPDHCAAQSLLDEGCSAGSSVSSGSLPSAVKDFYDMVGSDGSFPSSFPESLRGQWECGTQDLLVYNTPE
ncbi:hypothetical protein C8R47DRAFT_1096731 [Mycena vitilis]|nr:hypothetical protein C8R47DRAFT_1096731 [Mycena vitilis]